MQTCMPVILCEKLIVLVLTKRLISLRDSPPAEVAPTLAESVKQLETEAFSPQASLIGRPSSVSAKQGTTRKFEATEVKSGIKTDYLSLILHSFSLQLYFSFIDQTTERNAIYLFDYRC